MLCFHPVITQRVTLYADRILDLSCSNIDYTDKTRELVLSLGNILDINETIVAISSDLLLNTIVSVEVNISIY